MIFTKHQDCPDCQRMAVEAETMGIEHTAYQWTSTDGEHVARWEGRP